MAARPEPGGETLSALLEEKQTRVQYPAVTHGQTVVWICTPKPPLLRPPNGTPDSPSFPHTDQSLSPHSQSDTISQTFSHLHINVLK